MSDTNIFDMRQLLTAAADDAELAAQVAGVFLTDIPERLAALRSALDAADAKTAERAAHSIKGAAATVGGEALRAAAFECELLGRAGDFAALRGKLPALQEQYARLESELRANGFREE